MGDSWVRVAGSSSGKDLCFMIMALDFILYFFLGLGDDGFDYSVLCRLQLADEV